MFLLSRMDAHTTTVTASLYMFVLGSGLGRVMQVLVLAVQNAVDYAELGVATSAATLFRSIGGSVGTAVLGSIFASHLTSSLAAKLPAGAAARGLAGGGQVNPAALHALPAPIHQAYVAAFTDSLSVLFLVATVIGAVAFVLTFFIKQVPLRDTVATAGVGEAFAAPKETTSLAEIERELSTLTRREAGRRLIERLARRAGVDLTAPQCVLLARLDGDPHLDLAALAAARNVEPARVEAVADELVAGGLTAGPGGPGGRALTPAGHAALELLLSTGRRRLNELLDGWRPGEYPELVELVTRVARELLVDTSQLDRLLTTPAAPAV